MRRKIRNPKAHKRKRRHWSIRNKVHGTAERPRVCVFRSRDHIYAQVIDDMAGVTITSVSSLKIDASELKSKGASVDARGDDKGEGKKKSKKKTAVISRRIMVAREVGRLLAEAASSKGVTKIVFDRGGYLYHGRVAALADSARKNGLEF